MGSNRGRKCVSTHLKPELYVKLAAIARKNHVSIAALLQGIIVDAVADEQDLSNTLEGKTLPEQFFTG